LGVTKVEALPGSGDKGIALMVRYEKEDPRAAIFKKAVELNWILLEMRRKEVTLEETFRRLTME
jgi:ABC-2 type transport system ATP-binding protein